MSRERAGSGAEPAVSRRTSVGLLGHYLRRYTLWILLALAAVLFYAATTTGLLALIEPLFAEVLQAERPQELSLLSSEDDAEGEGEGEEEADVRPEWLRDLGRRLDVEAQLESSYESLKRRLGITEDEVVVFVPILFVLVFLLRSAASFVSGYTFQRVGLGLTTDIRNDLYSRILDQSSRFHARHPSGELVSRVVSDVALMQNAVSNRLLDLFQQSVTLVALLWLLLSTDFELALLCLVAAPVMLYPIVRFGKGMRRTSHRSQERMADLASLLAEGVRGHRVVKAFGMEGFENARFREATARHLKVNLRAQQLANLSSPVVESMAVVGAAALLVYAGNAIRAGELTAPELVKFLLTLLMMYDPVRKLNKVNLILQEALAAAQRVERLLATPNDIVEKKNAHVLPGVERGITYEGVEFGYEEEEPVLRGVDLEIRRGEIVALVGPSGAGKSTLVHLLPRFFDPDGGRVAIDGHDLRDLTLASLRAAIAVVSQESVLFNDTVRANIAYGRSDLELDRVHAAARAAYADEFIDRMPEGYDTLVGEGGLRLSGGQRQRLAIARAILKDAPILILDEATSALDSHSEALVQKALANLVEGRTTLVIAHRLSTVTSADRIVVMEAGRIVEQGSHAELVSRDGPYKRLYDLQFKG